MWRKSEPIELLGLFFAIVLLVSLCVLVSLFFARRRAAPKPTVVIQVVEPQPADVYVPPPLLWTYLPLISGGMPETPQDLPQTLPSQDLWKVISVEDQAYEQGGQRFDVANFQRVGDNTLARGYCIDRGLDVPLVGTEYVLSAAGIFTAIQPPNLEPYQRFQLIQ